MNMLEYLIRLFSREKSESCELLPHSWFYKLDDNKIVCSSCVRKKKQHFN